MANAAEPRSRRDLVAETLRLHRAEFEAFVRARVPAQEVDDVLQIAALRAIENAESLDDTNRVIAWIYRIHRNLIIDTYRKQTAERRHVDDDAGVPEVVATVADDPCHCSVIQARRLPSPYASILGLVDTDGLELSEAAVRLDITKNNAAVRLHRARKALRTAMLEHCGVTDPRACAGCRCVDDVCCAA